MSDSSLSSFTLPLSGINASESLESNTKKNARKIGLTFYAWSVLLWFWLLTLIFFFDCLPLSPFPPQTISYPHVNIQHALAKILSKWRHALWQFFPLMFALQVIDSLFSKFCNFFLTKQSSIFDFVPFSVLNVTPVNQKIPLSKALIFSLKLQKFWKNWHNSPVF